MLLARSTIFHKNVVERIDIDAAFLALVDHLAIEFLPRLAQQGTALFV